MTRAGDRTETMLQPAQRALPRLAMTIGDVAGVGPELVVRALAETSVRSGIVPVVFGPLEPLQRAARLVGVKLPLRAVPSVDETVEDWEIACIDAAREDAASIPPGVVDSRAGRIAGLSLKAAADAAIRGRVDALVTAPLNKLALHQAGFDHPGHTELLAELCGVKDVAMMLFVPPGDTVKSPHGLGIAHVTLHTSIASVPRLLTEPAILKTIRLVHEFMQQVGVEKPRIGVCALNPHAGEGGLFGNEEQRVIEPAVAAMRRDSGIEALGPFPADTLMMRAIGGEFDGVVAMYHDQGHIAVKLVAFHRAVNVTLGLPIIRTSPTQGTAFDIAWRGTANPAGMIEAIRLAARLAAR